MPYKSKAQMRYMHAKHPEIAKRWDEKYGMAKALPERSSNKRKKLRSKTSRRLP